ncbi:beta-1,4-glucuronosyltransferase WelK [Novosphingobium huizhouense]|uniref:beta-1,4-glucuronosyltransferase WelK n=1 Tax=Novosphingobium huizhouense TaxID=2866625 RepID=UPI001CD90F4F|nr:glycosyltransferase [Novosphingobium huizhouense]
MGTVDVAPRNSARAALKVCLAASGGGHLRQLLDIEEVWRDTDYFVLTEDTALGRSFATRHPTVFVSHVALGQARLGRPFLMLARAMRNCFESFRHIRDLRPQVLITTGAGSTFFAVIWARLFGAKVIVLDSLARVRSPSKFARIAGPAANLRIAQSVESASAWEDAVGFDTVRKRGPYRGAKEPLVFATVGATLPFERLTRIVTEAKASGEITESLILQVGDAEPVEGDMRCVQNLAFDEINHILARASIVICHGGTGSVVTALKAGCHVIAVPRRFDLGEHYDNHQEEITEALAALGVLRVANTTEELVEAIRAVRSAPAQVVERDMRDLIAYMTAAIRGWFPPGGLASPLAAREPLRVPMLEPRPAAAKAGGAI